MPEVLEEVELDALFAQLLTIKDELKMISSHEKAAKAQLKVVEAQVMDRMKEQGLTRSGNDSCLVRINTKTVPQVEDWEALYNYVGETGYFQLFQRRLASTAWSEINEIEPNSVPGINTVDIETLSVTKSR